METRNKMSQPEISYEAIDLITMVLQKDPCMRPSLEQIEMHPFFSSYSYLPKQLPSSTIRAPPSSEVINGGRRPQSLGNKNAAESPACYSSSEKKNNNNNNPLAATLRKNLEFLEENIENLRVEMEMEKKNLVKVQHWVDYTKKYGMGYKLTDGTYGVIFNDQTALYCNMFTTAQKITYIPVDKT